MPTLHVPISFRPVTENMLELFFLFGLIDNGHDHHLLHVSRIQGWKILKFFTRPTSPYVLVNSIINIGNSQNFYSSYSIRHLPWRADEWIFPALGSQEPYHKGSK